MKYWRYKVLEVTIKPDEELMQGMGDNGWELVAVDARMLISYYVFKFGYDVE